MEKFVLFIFLYIFTLNCVLAAVAGDEIAFPDADGEKIVFFSKPKPAAKSTEAGYKGTLPNIESYFQYKRENTKSNTNFSDSRLNEKNLIKAPLDDSLFVDIILNKGKKSPYTNDMLAILEIFQKFRTSLTKEITIQQYNAQVNVIDLYVKKLMQNYGETSHALADSYLWCQQINYRAKVLGNLMYDSNYYSKYMPVSNTQYSPQSIEGQKANLVKELDKAIFVLKKLND